MLCRFFSLRAGSLLHVARDLAGLRLPSSRTVCSSDGVADRRLVGDRAVRNAPAQSAAIVVGDLGGVDALDRRRRRLDRDDRLHQVRTRVGDQPAERAALRMRQQDDRRADHVEQRDVGVARQRLLPSAGEKLHLRPGEVVEDLVADAAGARPLRVLLGLRKIAARRRRRERLLEVRRGADVQVQTVRRAVDAGHVLRAAARRKILEVDDVAHVEEVVGPARPAVRRLQPVDAGLPGAVQEHDRIRRSNLLGHHHFDVHGAAHRRFLVRPELADVLAAGVEEPVTRDVVERDGRNRRWHRTGAWLCACA